MRYFILALLAVSVLPCFAQEQSHTHSEGQTSLTVNVINGTANGHPVAGDEVTVEIYKGENLVDTLRQKVAPDGKAVFENIKLSEHLAAYPKVRHMDMSFSGRGVDLCPDAEQGSVKVHVFDVSFGRSRLSVTTHHIMIKQKDNSVVVSEFLQLKNSSDMAITSKETDNEGKAVVLKMSLPKGFKDFSVSSYFEQQALVFDEDGFYDTMAVLPGSHKIVFSYALDINSKEINLIKKISLPTSNLIVFSQLKQGNIEGLGESSGQFVMDDGALAEYYVRNKLAADEDIAFKITGLDVGIADKISWIIVAVVFIAITALAVYRLLPAKRVDIE